MRFFCIIFALFASYSFAETKYGNWEVDLLDEGFSIAKTRNESGSLLGVFCDNSQCVPFLTNDLTCEDGSIYPALANTSSGVYCIKMECTHLSKQHLYALPMFLLENVLKDNKIGFAFGTNSGRFKSTYFSLAGSTKAIFAAKALVNQDGDSSTPEKETEFSDTYL